MDSELARLISADTPPFNPRLAEGLAVEKVNASSYNQELKQWVTGALLYLHQLFQAAASSFPASLEYRGCSLCLPEEEYKFRTKMDWRDKLHKFDFARSNVRLAKIHLRYQNQSFTHYLYIPFVGQAGSFFLNGSRYFVAPVLKDLLITKKADRIFVRLMKTRFNVLRLPIAFLADGRYEPTQLHHTRLFRSEQKNKRALEGDKPSQKGCVSLIHYLFCKYGVTTAFETFAHTKPIIGGGEVNHNVYPQAEWIICSSTGVPPEGVRGKGYQPTNVHIAIRRTEYTTLVRKFVGAFFYVADHFPTRLTAQWVENKLLWRTLLGLFLFPSGRGEGQIQEIVNRHIEWLDEYVDFMTRAKIKQLGWPVNNTFELFAYIAEHYDQWWFTDKAPGPTMYGKELEVLYFLMGDFMKGIHNLCFALRRPQKRPLRIDKLQQMLSSFLHPALIFKVRRNHSELHTATASGDNMVAKITSKMVPQERYTRATHRSEEQSMKAMHPFELLHASVAEVGSYHKLSRTAPDGRSNVNMHLQLSPEGIVQRDPAAVELIDEIQREIEAARNK